MSHDWNPDTVFELLADRHVRRILAVTGVKQQSARDLTDACDCSLSTAYRRLNVLTNRGFLLEQTELGECGNHRSVYELNCSEIQITSDGGRVVVVLQFDDGSNERIIESPLD